MKLIITDTNVFFDVISTGVLPEFFALDYEICTTDFVANEILESDQRKQIEFFIRADKLTVFKLTPDEIGEIQAFRTTRRFKGITDKTVLWKSHQLKCILLTGDNKIRKEARDLKIEVHGSIWLIKQLNDKGIIPGEIALDVLERLKQINSRLPHEEINKLIKGLKK